MVLPFLDRERERARLERALARRQDSLIAVYGRRRLGKSRLVREVLTSREAVYYVGDERDAPLQRQALAREIQRLLPGFAAVDYPSWEPLLDRWWGAAPAGAVLALDEFPYLVASSPELPSLLQKLVDRRTTRRRKTVLLGSLQQMMQGLLLEASAPLYGRAEEILKLEPLGLASLGQAFGKPKPRHAVEIYGTWGGAPRYWELALDHRDRATAVHELVLDPLGVLHREPERLLRDDLRDTARASSILALIGSGCGRLSEIGGRLGQPATSLTRPLARLIDLGFVTKEVPWGMPHRDTKRTFYRITDPFLRFWYRFVEPNRSRLAAGQIGAVEGEIAAAFAVHLGSVWEDLVRDAVARMPIAGRRWLLASRWWGRGNDGKPLEIDGLAQAAGEPDLILAVEVKLRMRTEEMKRSLAGLSDKAARCPALQGKQVRPVVFVLDGPARRRAEVYGAADVLGAAAGAAGSASD